MPQIVDRLLGDEVQNASLRSELLFQSSDGATRLYHLPRYSAGTFSVIDQGKKFYFGNSAIEAAAVFNHRVALHEPDGEWDDHPTP